MFIFLVFWSGLTIVQSEVRDTLISLITVKKRILISVISVKFGFNLRPIYLKVHCSMHLNFIFLVKCFFAILFYCLCMLLGYNIYNNYYNDFYQFKSSIIFQSGFHFILNFSDKIFHFSPKFFKS